MKKISLMSQSLQQLSKILFGSVILLFFILLAFSAEVHEAQNDKTEWIGQFDIWFSQLFLGIRSPLLTAMALDITALGSTLVLSTMVIIWLAFLASNQKKFSGLYLIFVSLGCAFLTHFLKNYYERSRPDLVFRLTEVSGYSYPSGHTVSSTALYLTFAMIGCSFLKETSQKYFIYFVSFLLIVSIGLSRVYLGVHYPSDVLAGWLIGLSWVLLARGLQSIRSLFNLCERWGLKDD